MTAWRNAALLSLLLPLAATAHAEDFPSDEVVVTAPAEAPLTAASELRVTTPELAARPIARTGEILEAAPGLIATQHSGEGKANQYFLRGFNLDHGTDLSLTLDGMPLNMRTHAHGQGYADLSFLIPELLGGMLVRKGPYAADLGDFANAGAIDMAFLDSVPRSYAQATGGSFGYGRALSIGSFTLGEGRLLLAGEAAMGNGPWQEPEALRRLNGFARYSQGDAAGGFSLTAMAYAGRWNATDQIPARALSAGLITRYGTLDASDGGQAQRYSLSANWHRQGEYGITRIVAYAVRSTLDLFNNFTYFLNNPVNGDQFQHQDRRWLFGLDARHIWRGEAAGRQLEARIGLQTRHDDIALGLYQTEARNRLAPIRVDAVRQSSLGLWGDATWRATPWLRAVLGLRGDWVGGRVSSDLPANSGTAGEMIASPKAGLVFGPWWATEFFLNAGTGFHSNDLRGTTINVDPADTLTRLSRVPLLVRSRGAEIGLRHRWPEGLESSLALFVLTLGSEILFVGDAGTTEASRPSRRIGFEWTNRWRVN
ncbi:MAG: TonB-dependent receptor, partial [Roseococcus sp.]